MKRNSKYINILLVLLCIILTVALGGLVVWNYKEEQKEIQRLEKIAEQTEAKKEANKKSEKSANKESKENKENSGTQPTAEEAAAEAQPTETPAPAETVQAEGIVCWGDDLLSGSESEQYSYMNVLQRILQEKGSALPVKNKTIQGGGTLSMMKLAGVPDETLQGYITAHQQAANGAELYITEKGVRDFTPEELTRDDLNCIPVIFMGYYGGWNHDPNELAAQQEQILNTFSNKDRFIVVGSTPLDGSVTAEALDAALSQKWGEHYISMSALTTYPVSYYEAQEAMAQAIYQKMVDLKYI